MVDPRRAAFLVMESSSAKSLAKVAMARRTVRSLMANSRASSSWLTQAAPVVGLMW
jgi:hypothetical protein